MENPPYVPYQAYKVRSGWLLHFRLLNMLHSQNVIPAACPTSNQFRISPLRPCNRALALP